MTIWHLWEIFVVTYESCMISFLFHSKLGITHKKRKYLYFGTTLVILIISILNFSDIQMSFKIADSVTIYLSRLVGFMLFIIFTHAIFSSSFSEKVIWSSVPPFCMTISDFISLELLQRITHKSVDELTQFGSTRICVSGLYLLVSTVLYGSLILIGRNKKRSQISLPHYLRILLIVILLLGTITVDQLIDFSFYSNDLSAPAFRNKAAFVSISFFVVIFGVFILVQRIGELTQDLLNAQHYKISYDNYAELERSNSALKEAKHEIRNHLQILQGLFTKGDEKQFRDYFDEINGKYTHIDVALTSSTPLNILLASKISLARSHGFDVQYRIEVNRNFTDRYSAICSLVGNLFDNAIEACFTIPNELQRYITFEMLLKEEMLLINMENSADGYYRKNGDTFLTRKKGVAHGMGLQICKRIVDQYEGYIQFLPDSNRFTVNIMLPLDNLTKEQVIVSNEKHSNH